MSESDDMLNKILVDVKQLSPAEMDKFFRDMAVASIGIIRGKRGDEFTQGFLLGALEDTGFKIMELIQEKQGEILPIHEG